jgi:fatty acid desaturase
MPADNKTADKAEVKDAAGAAGAADKAGASQGSESDVLAAGAAAAQSKHATMRYATLRIAIFLVSLAVLWGLVAATGHIVTGNGVLYLMMGALLISGAASFFLLSRQRDAMSVQVTRRAERMTGKFEANAAMEDED